MNGKRMPSDAPEMKAMLTYMQWLSQDRKVKPLDMDVGPYDDSFSTTQHRYGPYTNMIKK
ncbi:hypothetical protein AT913_00245 [Campylobacter jejuni]|nr:hypothetical protein [Campylobacter jejuni]MBW1429296.1 hypothetical protein [Campylobacter jejuni]BEK33524.1 hypothetical protein B11447_09660 [Campylobacter jejuni]